jgi:hypothetical protein
MTSLSFHEIFDDSHLSAKRILCNHSYVENVEFLEKPGASYSELAKWEESHSPFILPDDLKAFYCTQNGMYLKWKIRFLKSKLLFICLMNFR